MQQPLANAVPKFYFSNTRGIPIRSMIISRCAENSTCTCHIGCGWEPRFDHDRTKNTAHTHTRTRRAMDKVRGILAMCTHPHELLARALPHSSTSHRFRGRACGHLTNPLGNATFHKQVDSKLKHECTEWLCHTRAVIRYGITSPRTTTIISGRMKAP